MSWLDGQVALVTGAAAGIGRAVALRFVAEGASVVALDRDADGLATLAVEGGDAISTILGDASTGATNDAAVALALERFGRLDTLVGNVGIFDWNKRIDRLDSNTLDAAFNELFAVNVKAHLQAARAAATALRAARGSAIFTCSNASFRAGGGGVLYTATKFAVRGLVLQLAAEWAPDVRVNGVAPGGTVTSLRGTDALGSRERSLDGDARRIEGMVSATPLGFAARPEDHAGLYVTLASRANAAAVTGAVFVSDGGLTISV